MATTYRLDVVAPERSVLSRDVTMIIVRGSEGDLGILAHHIPLVTRVLPCAVDVRGPEGDSSFFALSGGFLEVRDDHVTLLAQSAELAEEIDVTRARAAKERAEQRLAERSDGLDVVRAQSALARAEARLLTATRIGARAG